MQLQQENIAKLKKIINWLLISS